MRTIAQTAIIVFSAILWTNPVLGKTPSVCSGKKAVALGFNLGQNFAIEQTVRIRGNENSDSTNYRGNINAFGTFTPLSKEGSWYVGIQEPDLKDTSFWQFNEARIWLPTETVDFLIGQQPTFWESPVREYWGTTAIHRWGFTSPPPTGGKFNLCGRGGQGKLNPGTSTLIVSSGFSREKKGNDFFGELTSFRGGIAFRSGVTKDFTVGAGIVDDQSVIGLAELLYQPDKFPLSLQVNAVTNTKTQDWNYQANLSFKPSSSFDLNLSSDLQGGAFRGRHSQAFRINWQPVKGINFKASGNNLNHSLAFGTTISRQLGSFTNSVSLDLDTDNNLRWRVRSELGNLQFNYQATENEPGQTTKHELTYPMDSHTLTLGYETFASRGKENNLTQFSLRYRSPTKSQEGRHLFELNFGYGIGSAGNGVIVSATTAIIPGLRLRGSFEDISLTANTANFRLDISSRIELGS